MSSSTMDKDYSIIVDEKKGATITTVRDVGFLLGGKVHVIPRGFCSDGFSCPRWAQRIVAPQLDPRTLESAVKHDWLYQAHICSRFFADVVFFIDLLLHGFPFYKAVLTFVGVRFGGWRHW